MAQLPPKLDGLFIFFKVREGYGKIKNMRQSRKLGFIPMSLIVRFKLLRRIKQGKCQTF